MTKITCEDCGKEFPIPEDYKDGEIVSCPVCGLEHYAFHTSDGIKINVFQFEGE